MTNKEKLIAIIGEENFRKLEANLAINGKDPIFFIHNYGINVLVSSFCWDRTNEGYDFWSKLHQSVLMNWKSIEQARSEEHELLFKMLCVEWMEYPQGDNERWYETVFSEGVGLKVYEALRSE